MPIPAHEILRESIARNIGITLSLVSEPAESHRSRLLAEAPQGGGVWVEAIRGEEAALATNQIGQSVSISFRSGEHIVSFATPILRNEPLFRLSADTLLPAILLAWPADVRLTQRRSGYRVRVPLDAAVKARAWRAPFGTDNWGTEIAAELHDLSVSGMGLILRPATTKATLPKIERGDRLKIELAGVDDAPLVLFGRLPQPPHSLPAGAIRVGMDYDNIRATIEGRRTLAQVTRLVADLQRTHARRRRAG